MKLDTVDKVLDYAIQKEQDAADFYTDLAGKVQGGAMESVFKGFAREEMGHKAKLESVKKGNRLLSSEKQIQDLKIGDHLVEPEPAKKDLTYQEALILAIKAEMAAFKLYSELAIVAKDSEVQELMLGLAQEEAKHKLRFELEYDEKILTEN